MSFGSASVVLFCLLCSTYFAVSAYKESNSKPCSDKALHLVIDEFNQYKKSTGIRYSDTQLQKLIKKHCGD